MNAPVSFTPVGRTGDEIMLMVAARTSTDAGDVGFLVVHTDEPTTQPVAWVGTVDLCTALSALFALSITEPGGRPLGGEFDWLQRPRVSREPDGGLTVMSCEPDGANLGLRARIEPPTVTISPRGNLVVTPSNERVSLVVTVDGESMPAHPDALLDVLIEIGMVARYSDWQKVFTRHLRPAAAAFEVWPDGRTVPAARYERPVKPTPELSGEDRAIFQRAYPKLQLTDEEILEAFHMGVV